MFLSFFNVFLRLGVCIYTLGLKLVINWSLRLEIHSKPVPIKDNSFILFIYLLKKKTLLFLRSENALTVSTLICSITV